MARIRQWGNWGYVQAKSRYPSPNIWQNLATTSSDFQPNMGALTSTAKISIYLLIVHTFHYLNGLCVHHSINYIKYKWVFLRILVKTICLQVHIFRFCSNLGAASPWIFICTPLAAEQGLRPFRVAHLLWCAFMDSSRDSKEGCSSILSRQQSRLIKTFWDLSKFYKHLSMHGQNDHTMLLVTY